MHCLLVDDDPRTGVNDRSIGVPVSRLGGEGSLFDTPLR